MDIVDMGLEVDENPNKVMDEVNGMGKETGGELKGINKSEEKGSPFPVKKRRKEKATS